MLEFFSNWICYCFIFKRLFEHLSSDNNKAAGRKTWRDIPNGALCSLVLGITHLKTKLGKSEQLPWAILTWLPLIIIPVCWTDQAGKAEGRENSSMRFLCKTKCGDYYCLTRWMPNRSLSRAGEFTTKTSSADAILLILKKWNSLYRSKFCIQTSDRYNSFLYSLWLTV